MNVFDLYAKISLDSKEYDEGVKDAGSKFESLAGGISKTLGAVTAAVGAAVTAAATGVASIVSQSVQSFGEYEQLVGGAKKIFDEMDYSQIAQDASDAWMNMNLSASDYLSMINNVGASFAATMGDQKGYETAKQGMQAIADYASGTGKNVNLLNEKFAAITRSASSYQSIADQFSGILPATSKDFLAQAQAAGILSTKYKQLTEVPIAEYQQAVSAMLQKGVEDLGLASNTANETLNTITGSIAGLKATWQNLITGMASGENLQPLINNLVQMAQAVVGNVMPAVSQALVGIAQLIQSLAPTIATEIPNLVSQIAPMLLEAATNIVSTLVEALPMLLQSIFDALTGILPQLTETVVSLLDTLIGTIIPMILAFGAEIIMQLGQALLDNASQMTETLTNVILTIVQLLTEALPQLITVAVAIISTLAQGISDNAPMIMQGILVLMLAILQSIIENLPTLIEAGLTIISGLIDGILNNLPLISQAVVILITTFVTTILEHLPDILVAAIEIGAKIVLGIVMAIPSLIVAVGKMLGIVQDTKDQVTDHSNTMQSAVNTSTTGINSDINGMIENLNQKTNEARNTLSTSNREFTSVQDDMNKKADDLNNTAKDVQRQMTISFGGIRDIVQFARAAMDQGFEQMTESMMRFEEKFRELGAMQAAPTVDPSGVVDACQEIVEAVEDALEALADLANASGGGGGGFGGGHAKGGWMQAGTTYLVGELGPELVTPSRSGYVHTAEETASMLGRGQSINITIQGDVYDNAYSMRKKLRNAMLDVLQEQVVYG